MRLTLLCVGKLRNAALKEICADYLARLQRYGPAEVKEVKAADGHTAEQSREVESERLMKALDAGDEILILDERGTQIGSRDLAEILNKSAMRAVKKAVLVLGGAYGLTPELRARGRNLALSRLTLPHELCRAVILEQLYRARTIQKGEPYHHD